MAQIIEAKKIPTLNRISSLCWDCPKEIFSSCLWAMGNGNARDMVFSKAYKKVLPEDKKQRYKFKNLYVVTACKRGRKP